jgi:hypothetical protein
VPAALSCGGLGGCRGADGGAEGGVVVVLERIVWGTEWEVLIEQNDLDAYREQVAMDAAGAGLNGVPPMIGALAQ